MSEGQTQTTSHKRYAIRTCPTVAPTQTPVQSVTQLSNPRRTARTDKPQAPQPVINSPAFYGNRRSLWSPAPVPALDQINPVYHPLIRFLLKSVLILPTHGCLVFPSCLFPSTFPTIIMHAFLFFHRRATCPTNLIVLDVITLIINGQDYIYIYIHIYTHIYIIKLLTIEISPFSRHFLLRPTYSQTASACVTRLHTHAKQKA